MLIYIEVGNLEALWKQFNTALYDDSQHFLQQQNIFSTKYACIHLDYSLYLIYQKQGESR